MYFRSTVGTLLASMALSALLLTGCGGGEEAGEAVASTDVSGAATTTGDRKAAGNTDPTLAVTRQQQQPPIDLAHPKVLIETSIGEMMIKLDAENAPLTVDNFLAYVDSGHYAGTIFHQVVGGYIALGGGYDQDLQERTTRTGIRNEADHAGSNRRGTIAMARSFDAIDSARSQFFFNLADNPELDHKGRTAEEYGYCVFGEVVEGLDVLDKISAAQVHDTENFESIPVEPIEIIAIRRFE